MAIIQSLLDIDVYKFYMWQYAFHKYPHARVKYNFKCRTPDVRLAKVIDKGRLIEELDHVRSLRFSQDELDYLASLQSDNKQIFKRDFRDHLSRIRLLQYDLEEVDDSFKIEFEGYWSWIIAWETICLSIISELYGEALTKGFSLNSIIDTCLKRLDTKKSYLSVFPLLRFSDFSTRRRFSRLLQEIIIADLLHTKQFAGTSNVFLSKRYGLKPIGTMAHEVNMFLQGAILQETRGDYSQLIHTPDRVMNEWEEEYGYDMRINLPDTFSSDWELERMTEERMRNWKGERHDSGSPEHFADRRIDRWRKFGINPKEKKINFSDGLEAPTIRNLYIRYKDVTQPGFGWGTDLGNDAGPKPISIVVKLTESNGYGTIKLSDNWAKAIGKPEDIERAKKIFELTEGHYEEVKY